MHELSGSAGDPEASAGYLRGLGAYIMPGYNTVLGSKYVRGLFSQHTFDILLLDYLGVITAFQGFSGAHGAILGRSMDSNKDRDSHLSRLIKNKALAMYGHQGCPILCLTKIMKRA